MSWYTVFYLFSVADGLGTFFGWMAFIGTAGFLVSAMLWTLSHTTDMKNDSDAPFFRDLARRWLWRSMVIGIIGWAGYVLIPNKKDMLLIIAGGAVGNFLTSDTSARQLPADVTQYLHKAIQAQVKDLDLPIEAKRAMGTATKKEEFLDKVKDLTKEEIIERIKTDTMYVKQE